MGRLIDADKLKEELTRLCDSQDAQVTATNGIFLSGVKLGMMLALELLEAVPAVEAEQVQHGHVVWVDRITGGYRYAKTRCHNCGVVEEVEIEHPMENKIGYCSECNARLDDIFMKYCPNCGARLDLNTLNIVK